MDRRTALKWMATAAASAALLDRGLLGAQPASAKGYGTDPDLLKTYTSGELWPLTLTAAQQTTAATLCDVIIPADAKGPSASSLKVQDFIDEWISAPYPGHDADKALVLDGLRWLDDEGQRRFQQTFTTLSATQQAALCDDICYLPNAKPEHRRAAQFFQRFRDLAASGYYSTPEGMRDIGYTGNVALEKYEGPTPEALKHLGLA
jgi:hypothetical protein